MVKFTRFTLLTALMLSRASSSSVPHPSDEAKNGNDGKTRGARLQSGVSNRTLRRKMMKKSSGGGTLSSANDPAVSNIAQCQDSSDSSTSRSGRGMKKSSTKMSMSKKKSSSANGILGEDVCGNSARAVNPMITPGTIFGTGNNENRFWTCQQTADIELCLRAKQRYPTRQEPDGSYQLPDGNFRVPTTGNPTDSSNVGRANWNFEWHVNVDRRGVTGDKLSDWDFRLVLDTDPGCEICPEEYFQFLPGYNPPDHDFGNNMTPNSRGITVSEYCTANAGAPGNHSCSDDGCKHQTSLENNCENDNCWFIHVSYCNCIAIQCSRKAFVFQ